MLRFAEAGGPTGLDRLSDLMNGSNGRITCRFDRCSRRTLDATHPFAEPHCGRPLLEVQRLIAAAGGELVAIVADELAWGAAHTDGGLHGLPRRGGGEPAYRSGGTDR